MNQCTSISRFCSEPLVAKLIVEDFTLANPDTPFDETVLHSHVRIVERKLNTALELHRGDSVYKDEIDELRTCDLSYLSNLYTTLAEIVNSVSSIHIDIKVLSINGDLFIKERPYFILKDQNNYAKF